MNVVNREIKVMRNDRIYKDVDCQFKVTKWVWYFLFVWKISHTSIYSKSVFVHFDVTFHALLYRFDYLSCVGDYAWKTSCQKTDIKSNEMHAKWLKYVIGFRLYSLETAYLYRSCKYFHQSRCLLIYNFENKKIVMELKKFFRTPKL